MRLPFSLQPFGHPTAGASLLRMEEEETPRANGNSALFQLDSYFCQAVLVGLLITYELWFMANSPIRSKGTEILSQSSLKDFCYYSENSF